MDDIKKPESLTAEDLVALTPAEIENIRAAILDSVRQLPEHLRDHDRQLAEFDHEFSAAKESVSRGVGKTSGRIGGKRPGERPVGRR